MSVEKRADGSIWIQEYSLKDFVMQIQEQVQAGYEVSLTNESYPQGFSGHFTVGMTEVEVAPKPKAAPKAAKKADTQTTTE